jgi:hypothetical protein
VGILLSKLGNRPGEYELKHESTLYDIGYMFCSLTEWNCELVIGKEKGSQFKYSHCGVNLDMVEGTGATNQGCLVYPKLIPLLIYFGRGFVFSRYECLYMLMVYWSNSLR